MKVLEPFLCFYSTLYFWSFLVGQFSAFPLLSEGTEVVLFACLEVFEHITATCWMQGEHCWALINLVWYSRWLLQICVSAQSSSRKEVIHLHLLFLLLCLKKSKRSAYESGEEHSAKYSNSNNSGNYREKSLLLHSCDSFFVVPIIFWLKRSRVTISLHGNIGLPKPDSTVLGI